MRFFDCTKFRWLIMVLVVAVAGLACSGNTAGPNRPPVANAGPDFVAEAPVSVSLDGSRSYDPDNDKLSFEWSLLLAPDNSKATLSESQTSTPTLFMDRRGVYLVGLVVSDRRQLSDTDVIAAVVSECDDHNPCTEDERDEQGICQHRTSPEGTHCDTCGACNSTGQCVDNLGQNKDCPKCQQCAPGKVCVDQPAGLDLRQDCQDNSFCNGKESCNGAGGCQAGSYPCGNLSCSEEQSACTGCTADKDCPPCHQCDLASQRCLSQVSGDDKKNDCEAGSCWTGACDGNGACGFVLSGSKCGVCASCDVSGRCLDDLSRNNDCPFCQQCAAGKSCINQVAGNDIKGECPLSPCHPGTCNGSGICDLSPPGAQCEDQMPEDCGDAQCDAGGACIQSAAPEVSGYKCRQSLDECDVDEICDGASLTCPVDQHAADGVSCASGGGLCCQAVCRVAWSCCTGRQCNDLVDCTLDMCNEGSCSHAFMAAGTPCDGGDGDFCNSACDAQGGCQTGTPICDDGIFCTLDECIPSKGCQRTPRIAGPYCDGNDLVLCDALGGETRHTCSLGCDSGSPSRCLEVHPSNISDPAWLCQNTAPLVLESDATIDLDSGTISGFVGVVDFSVVQQGDGAPEIGVFVFDRIDISPDVTVTVSSTNSSLRGLALLACGDINIGGVIRAKASGISHGAGGWNGGGSMLDGSGYNSGNGKHGEGDSESPWLQNGGGGGAFGASGGTGGNTGEIGGAGGQSYGTDELIPVLGGSGGGGGGTWGTSGGLGGGGGGAIEIVAGGTLTIGVVGGVDVAGAGGYFPADDGAAGGGGGAGGGILLEGVEVVINGTLAANGGGGGGGDQYTGSATATAGEDGKFGGARAGGGLGGGNNGGDGGLGGAADTPGGDNGGNGNGSGGGGGAAGRIRINTQSGLATINAGSIISPASGFGFSQGLIQVW